jgi:hypothetical protein
MRRPNRIGIFWIVLVGSGCSSQSPTVRLPDPQIYDFTAEGSFPLVPDGQALAAAPSADVPMGPFGWRVQVFAGESQDLARDVQQRLQMLVPETVYIDHVEPHYKVRIGDCLRRDACDSLQARLLALGAESAWVVATPIHQVTQP